MQELGVSLDALHLSTPPALDGTHATPAASPASLPELWALGSRHRPRTPSMLRLQVQLSTAAAAEEARAKWERLSAADLTAALRQSQGGVADVRVRGACCHATLAASEAGRGRCQS